MWSIDRYVRCQAYASGPMSIPKASHNNYLQKIEKCHVLIIRSMYTYMLFEKSERSEDTELISGAYPTKSSTRIKTFK